MAMEEMNSKHKPMPTAYPLNHYTIAESELKKMTGFRRESVDMQIEYEHARTRIRSMKL
jgi:hypothetical protein